MRSRSWLVAVFVVMAVQMSPMLEKVSAQSAPGIVISELRFSGPGGISDEFIELFNASDAAINIGGWEVRVSGGQSTSNAARTRIPLNTVVRPGCYYLLTFTPGGAGYSGPTRGDMTYATGFADDGGVAIGPSAANLVDQVGFHPNTLYQEPVLTFPPGPPGTGAITFGGLSRLNRSFERKPIPQGTDGPNVEYTNGPNPQSSASPCVLPEGSAGYLDTNNNATDFRLIVEEVKPHKVQGTDAVSPMAFAVTTVKGVVTARARNGFFIQTEVGEDDGFANTSEGLFVFTGFGVTVPATAQVGHLVQVSGSVEEFVPPSDPRSPSRTQLRFSSLTDLGTAAMPDAYVLTATDLSAAGAPDQLERLEGMRVNAASLTAVSETASNGVFYAVLTEQFDDQGSNPDRLRVDSDGIEGIDWVEVIFGAVMSDVTGPLDFESRTYTLFPEAVLAPIFPPDVDAPVIDPTPDVPAVEATGPDGAAVRFPTPGATDNRDDVVTVTCTPASGSTFGLGDSTVTCSAVDQAGNAAETVAFTVTVQDTTAPVFNPTTESVTAEATGPNGAMVNFPVPTATDSVDDAVTVTCTPDSGSEFGLGNSDVTCSASDRAGNREAVSFTVTVVDTTEPVITVPDDISAEATSPGGRVVTYNATAHDTVSGSLVVSCSPVSGSLFPLNNTAVTCSASDVAGNLAEASFSVTVADTTAPVFNSIIEAVTAEATGPNGAMVNFPVPTATDLDEMVAVNCSPAAGSLFGLGTTIVTCGASDAAGNPAYVRFTVTVQDTTAPAITVPEDISAQASSPAGGVVTYTVSARDAVSESVVASCSPASGSTFPIGTTDVKCTASDAAGLVSEAHFSVSISEQALQGRMRGAGSVASGQQRVSFTFDAGESASQVDRGWMMMLVKDGAGRPRSFAGKVDYVSFSNAEGYTPGQTPASGVDTVMFSGVGSWNGRQGYSFRVTASDRGEPGVNNDTFTIVVTLTETGAVVESSSGVLRGGNIQSLR